MRRSGGSDHGGDGRRPASAAAAASALRAFTLLELVVVIAVLGILSAMIVPEFAPTYRDALLRASARELASVMGLAASRAAALGRPQLFRLDPGSGRYRIVAAREEPEAEVEEEATAAERPPVLLDDSGKLDPRVRALVAGPEEGDEEPRAAPPGERAEEAEIEFRPDGTADPRSIFLSDREGNRLLLRIDPINSRVRVEEAGEEAGR